MSPIFQFQVSVVLCSYALCNLIHSSYFVYFYVDWRYAIYYAQCFIRHCAVGLWCVCVYVRVRVCKRCGWCMCNECVLCVCVCGMFMVRMWCVWCVGVWCVCVVCAVCVCVWCVCVVCVCGVCLCCVFVVCVLCVVCVYVE